ncbi:MAG: hypothetical protein V4585_09525 [Bacteroidota bacterium]|jgi:hypothetical protein
MITEQNTLCPSSKAETGAILLGVITPQEQVAMFSEQVVINQEFIDSVSSEKSAESQFRFANRCVKSGCQQWASGRCGVIDAVMKVNPDLHVQATNLPTCSIRLQCRWHQQVGANACVVCPFIITDSQEIEEDRLVYVETNEWEDIRSKV